MGKQAPRPSKRLAIFLDGTWNQISNNTNVWRMKAMCAPFGRDEVPQVTYYDIGVNGLIGGTFGKGLSGNIIKAYKWLTEEYAPGDEIYIFGFSRGAYTARSLAGLIAICGLPKLGAPLGIDQIYERYKDPKKLTIYQLREAIALGKLEPNDCDLEARWMLKYMHEEVPIKMVGVWDTVGKIGVPFGNIRKLSSKYYGFLHTGLRQSMEHCFHAIAIDERRRAFPPTLWTVRQKHGEPIPTARALDRCEQRWFVGAHGNIGGGYPSDVLAQIPFMWLLRKAEGLGLTFRNEVGLDGDLASATVANSRREFLKGFYQIISPLPKHREIAAAPEKDERGIHWPVNETIDASVFEYWQKCNYKPKSLRRWAKAKGVDPTKINSSVLASDPTVALTT